MGDGGDDAQANHETVRQQRERARSEPASTPTAKGSERIPTVPPEGDDLEDDGRPTEKMSAAYVRSMLAAHLPAPLRDLPAPVEHEEVASSSLMAEAMAQLRAGGPLRMKSESEHDDSEEIVARLRPAPSTIPISTQRLAEITASADTRPAIAMVPLRRPTPTERPRFETARLPPRSDPWMLVAICTLIVAAFAIVCCSRASQHCPRVAYVITWSCAPK